MENNFLKVFQIYYMEYQLSGLDYIPYYNEKCTVFFENSVIADLIKSDAHLGCEYFGVVSYKLKQKLGYMKDKWKGIPNIANHSTTEFTPALFESELRKHLPDVMSFQRHIAHDPISVAERFHPGFSKYFSHIMQAIGYHWKPSVFPDVFYCNYFVAKQWIYKRYVDEMLIPAMKVMSEMPELMQNSNYPHPLPSELKKEFGINHYPFHTFICERMFSYYAYENELECLHY